LAQFRRLDARQFIKPPKSTPRKSFNEASLSQQEFNAELLKVQTTKSGQKLLGRNTAKPKIEQSVKKFREKAACGRRGNR
jgi:hypothetical protein